MTWKKSSRSANSADCVEVAWHKSAFCADIDCVEVDWEKPKLCSTNGCVEVHKAHNEVWVRDSKDENSPILKFTREEWETFTADVKNGEFDI